LGLVTWIVEDSGHAMEERSSVVVGSLFVGGKIQRCVLLMTTFTGTEEYRQGNTMQASVSGRCSCSSNTFSLLAEAHDPSASSHNSKCSQRLTCWFSTPGVVMGWRLDGEEKCSQGSGSAFTCRLQNRSHIVGKGLQGHGL
jgi:hypothetical protein